MRVFGGAIDSDLNTLVGPVEKRKQRPPELLGLHCRNWRTVIFSSL
jgi:hypothetical protein